MNTVVSATDARVHFGELMRQVTETKQAVVVERGGKPTVAIVPAEEYEEWRAEMRRKRWDEWWKELEALHARLAEERGGQAPPEIDVAEMINDMREERSREIEEAIDALYRR